MTIYTSLPLLNIRGRELLPVIQGGMGVGISAHRLAGAVAKEGAVGTIASVDLRRLHPDLMGRLRKCHDPARHSAANLEALDREIREARTVAGPDGFIAVNVMRALSNYTELVVQACKSGAIRFSRDYNLASTSKDEYIMDLFKKLESENGETAACQRIR